MIFIHRLCFIFISVSMSVTFDRWFLHLRRSKKLLRFFKRISLNVFYSVLNTWKSYVQEKIWLRRYMYRMIHQNELAAYNKGMRTWKHATNAMKLANVQQFMDREAKRRQHQTMNQMLGRMVYRTQDIALKKWKTYRKNQKKYRRIGMRMMHLHLSRSFNNWYNHIKLKLAQRTLVRRSLDKMTHRRINQCMDQWCAHCSHARRTSKQDRASKLIMRRIVNRCLLRSFNKWLVHRSTMRKMRRFMLRAKHSQLHISFSSWCEHVDCLHRQRVLIQRSLSRVINGILHRCMDQWCAHVDTRKRFRQRIMVILQRGSAANMKSSLQKWKVFVTSSKNTECQKLWTDEKMQLISQLNKQKVLVEQKKTKAESLATDLHRAHAEKKAAKSDLKRALEGFESDQIKKSRLAEEVYTQTVAANSDINNNEKQLSDELENTTSRLQTIQREAEQLKKSNVNMTVQLKESASTILTIEEALNEQLETTKQLESQIHDQQKQIVHLEEEKSKSTSLDRQNRNNHSSNHMQTTEALNQTRHNYKEATLKIDCLEAASRALKLEYSNTNNLFEASRAEANALSIQVRQFRSNNSYLKIEMENIQSNLTSTKQKLKRAQLELDQALEQHVASTSSHETATQYINSQWRQKLQHNTLHHNENLLTKVGEISLLNCALDKSVQENRTLLEETTRLRYQMAESRRLAKAAETTKQQVQAELEQSQHSQVLATADHLHRDNLLQKELNNFKDLAASMHASTNHIVESSVNAMSLTHRAQLEAVQSTHDTILNQHTTEHTLNERRLQKQIQDQKERIDAMGKSLSALRAQEQTYVLALSEYKAQLYLTEGDNESLKDCKRYAEELEAAYKILEVKHDQLNTDHQQTLLSHISTVDEMKTYEISISTASHQMRQMIVKQTHDQESQLSDITLELTRLRAQVVQLKEQLDTRHIEHEQLIVAYQELEYERNEHARMLESKQQEFVEMATTMKRKLELESVKTKVSSDALPSSPASSTASDSDNDFEDALEPEKEPQSFISMTPATHAFFTPTRESMQATNNEQEAKSRVRQKIIAITARKWRDENDSLKNMLDTMTTDYEQIELENSDLHQALEAAELLNHDLHHARLVSGLLSMVNVLNESSIKTNMMAEAFHKLDRHRWCTQATGNRALLLNDTVESRSLVTTDACIDCDRREHQLQNLLLNLNDTAVDLVRDLQSLRSNSKIVTYKNNT